jgi:hypothetical protein
MQIKVNERVQVMFNVNDPIFQRDEPIAEDDTEELEEWSRCNCCGDA